MANWVEAKQMDERTQCLVYGFIKLSQKSLSKESSHSIIPDLIIWIILSFYHIKDEWDQESTHKSYKINGDSLLKIPERPKRDRTAFLKHVVTKGTYRWSFKNIKYN